MKRTKKVNAIKRNTPVALHTFVVADDDCFGNEWSVNDPICVGCSMYDFCMTLCLTTGVEAKKAEIKKKTTHFFDELDWSNVPWADLFELIMLEPKTVSYQDLLTTVKDLSKAIDNTTVAYKVQNWLTTNDIKISEGWLYL